MFDRIRDGVASGLLVFAQRVSTEQRSPGGARVSQAIRTLAGVTITADTAVTIATVWACLRYLSQTVAVLPWHVMRDGDNGAAVADKHIVDYLIYKRPNKEWSSFQFRETLVHWALRWGNGYAEIERDQVGRPFALWPIHPERVDVCRDAETGELYYEVSNGTGGKVEIAQMDMFHLRGFGEGPVGVNVIAYASQSLGWARAAQLFGATFFGNGMNVSGVVINKKPLKEAGLRRQKAEFEALYKGINGSNKTAFLDNDSDWKAIGIDPQKSQLIEVHQHLVEEVCRWFGVPPHKVMHLLRATFSNIEHQAIEVVIDSVSPWVKRFEDEADYKLFGVQNRHGFYTKMNMRALLRGDSKSRMEFYKGMFDMGAYSPNRILESEDENTLGPAGDKHLVQLNLTTLEKAGEQPEPSAPESTEPEVEPPEADETPNDAAAHGLVDLIEKMLEPA